MGGHRVNNHDVQDVKILQKVNAAHREAFKEKFPGQVEHCMRLTAERLQAVLTKRAATDPADPETWACTARDIADLAIALNHIYEIEQDLKRNQRI
jgi:hypothetical protein